MKILLIEPELSELSDKNNFFQWLENNGFTVSVAENTSAAIYKAKSELPDLIICNIVEVELDNYYLPKALCEFPTTAIIPLIFAIDKMTQANIRKTMEMGADDCISQSCTEKELLNAIAIRLDRLAFIRQWCTIQASENRFG
ncbi:response regulator with CheY-like receiver domain and winged-helix DNA-binding domain [Rivularia sp. PCC 7116]|uniref:response regulator transcription factor n=1 Tax=Rivularia sp. PCC 7116 TaxID=373994 RepID=UPI00029EF1AF|nr:response regulator [Rivularia sp. PCC 7116]AFY58576.1 response regulator with CheY-like receiver domain and winged-helix DNA-binding domain [Rivularia sp. PCC 7116]